MCRCRKTEFELEDALQFGTIPVVFNSADKREALAAYIHTYIEQEVQYGGLVRNIGHFNRFMEVLSFSHGSLVNTSDIARESEVLIDAGIYNGLRPKGPLDSPSDIAGAALEGLVFQHQKSWIDYFKLHLSVQFWRTKSGSEVDFVLYGQDGFFAIEVNSSTAVRKKDLTLCLMPTRTPRVGRMGLQSVAPAPSDLISRRVLLKVSARARRGCTMNLGKKSIEEFRELGRKLLVHMSPMDLAAVLFPPAMGLDVLTGLMSKEPLADEGFDPAYPEPALLDAVLDIARWLSVNYFTTEISRIENVPKDGPVLFAGNHSAGLMPLDALFAINSLRDYGIQTPVHPLVHDFAYTAPRVGKCAKRLGILRARKENALAALQGGHHVLVYPGGDEDAFRTFSERNRVILAGRKGFIRLAMAAKVPIVPLISVGLQESFVVLSKGRAIGRKLGLKKWLRTEIFPLSFSLPWGFGPAFTPFLPLPCSIDMRFLTPIRVDGSPDDDTVVNEAFEHIQNAMQTAMDELNKDRVPFFGR